MMIKIAICDDDRQIGGKLEEMLIKLLNNNNIRYEIDVFETGESLCREFERTEYDLMFLDIELPEMNGVQIGNYIRDVKKNNIVQIAYISSKQGYAMELFDVRPINFLIKPLEEFKVQKVIETYIKINGGKKDLFCYKKGFVFHRIEMYKIKYFEREGRKVIMHTLDGDVEFYESMEKIYETTKKYRFLFIHKSYMINTRYLKNIHYDRVTLVDGEDFPISQSRRKEIREMFKLMEED
ncbi:MAG: response regulator transcription factor [Lachnospiraceae bacterium]|nr:response regulator transcription factor [Lachnospiraceae bacterium]